MKARRLRTGGPAGESVPRQIVEDHDWLQDHRDELIEQYGECYMIVHKHQVLGTGQTYDEALNSAENNLSPEIDDLPIMVEWVGKRVRLSSIRTPQSGKLAR